MCPVCTKFPMGTCLPAHFGLDCKVFHKWMWGCPCHRLHSLDGCCRSWALQRWNVKPGVDQRYLNWSLPGWLSSNANLVFPLVLSVSPEESRETCGSFCIFCKECHLPPGECHKEFQHFSRTLWSKSPNRFGVQAPCMAHIALSQDGTACDWCANLHASVAKRTVSTCNCLRIDTSGEAVGHKKKNFGHLFLMTNGVHQSQTSDFLVKPCWQCWVEAHGDSSICFECSTSTEMSQNHSI